MKTMTFTLGNENEAKALVSFFTDCGISAKSKANAVKANGEENLLSHLFDIFVTTALV